MTNNDDFYAVFIKATHTPSEYSCPSCNCVYEPYTEFNYIDVIKCADIDELRSWLVTEEGKLFSKRKYEVVRCTPVKVTPTLKVDVKIQ